MGNQVEQTRRLARAVGNVFRTARAEQKLSQAQVASMSEGPAGGVSRALISAVECGRSLPGIEALVSISRVLRLDPREILERVELTDELPTDASALGARELVQAGIEEFYGGNYRRALAYYDVAQEKIDRSDSDDPELRRLRVWLEIDRSLALRRASALRSAQAAAERAVEFAREFEELRSECYVTLASVLSMRGLHVLARDIAERALAASESCSAQQQSRSWAQYAGTLLRVRELEEALPAYGRARELAIAADDRRHLAKIEGNIGSCLLEMNHPAQAFARFTTAIELSRKLGDRPSEAIWLVALGSAAVARQRDREAELCCRAAIRIARPLAQNLTVFRAEWLLYRILQRSQPGANHRQHLIRLRRLWRELDECHLHDELRDFEKTVLKRGERR